MIKIKYISIHEAIEKFGDKLTPDDIKKLYEHTERHDKNKGELRASDLKFAIIEESAVLKIINNE